MVHRPIASLALLALAFQTASAFLTPLSIGQLPILELRACLSGISCSAHRLCSVSGPLFPMPCTCIGTKKRTHAHSTRAYPPPHTHTHTHTYTPATTRTRTQPHAHHTAGTASPARINSRHATSARAPSRLTSASHAPNRILCMSTRSHDSNIVM